MKPDSKLASKIEGKDFIITAEYLPPAGTSAAAVEAGVAYLRDGLTAANAADNVNGIAMSSLAASLALMKAGVEPVYQLITRDRNRIALESDLLGLPSTGDMCSGRPSLFFPRSVLRIGPGCASAPGLSV